MKKETKKRVFEIQDLEERLEFAAWLGGDGEAGQDGCCNNSVCPCDDGPYEGGDGTSAIQPQ